jgi:hypothetical protein
MDSKKLKTYLIKMLGKEAKDFIHPQSERALSNLQIYYLLFGENQNLLDKVRSVWKIVQDYRTDADHKIIDNVSDNQYLLLFESTIGDLLESLKSVREYIETLNHRKT